MPRITCSQCQRPEKLCFCDSIVPVHNAINVNIIHHPQEQEHPFNTGRIAKLALARCQLINAEVLSESQLSSLMSNDSVLLYPSLSWLPESPPLPETINNLVVLDASWKKSKKILHLNPQLQSLPRLSLHNVPTSNYQIRLTKQPDGLSTIEAITFGLQQLENKAMDELLIPFQTMVERQLTMAAEQRKN